MRPSARLTRSRLGRALGLLPFVVVALLAWRWEAFASRSWPQKPASVAFTDDGGTLVTLDEQGTLRFVELDNPLDRCLGARRTVATRGRDGRRLAVIRDWTRGEVVRVP